MPPARRHTAAATQRKTSQRSPYFGAGKKPECRDAEDNESSNDDAAQAATASTLEQVYFPSTAAERKDFVNKRTGRRVTAFQFRVYDMCAQIPEVGQALRWNPFCPLPVPCHRVLTANAFIGGFSGEWGSGEKICSKRSLLAKEGLEFDDESYLLPDCQKARLFTDFCC
ncbi:hypothetical protein THASP1DRAFT_29780 [Thamnocephalis sphaerospora]|uniref:Methylated-DNA--protein-cysteine methyltransferase n=1 Tax=Thamnocephalis sphaerospora TaxID=78915 RepID=A0A4P9XR57_9FUNG|nr:hypothetical protein THASP1DRAFT_29780 [Thamnocephalis sphaerospora]|eukprot:RKP08402.1 hypothetical protein THASP1DRAFT_29780 [Thamnocephalis sphaerospora]